MTVAFRILSAVMHLVYYLFAAYYLLIIVRYLLDLLPLHLHGLRRSLFRLTEPFLSRFRGAVRLRWRGHDFNPLAAALFLFVFQQTVIRCLVFIVLKAGGSWCG